MSWVIRRKRYRVFPPDVGDSQKHHSGEYKMPSIDFLRNNWEPGKLRKQRWSIMGSDFRW